MVKPVCPEGAQALSIRRPAPVAAAGEAVLTAALSALPDAELARRIAGQDAQAAPALELVFMRHSPELLAFLSRALRDGHEAEDVLHDVFIKVAQTAQSYRGDSPLRAWLFSLALNLVRTRQRRQRLQERARQNILAMRPAVAAHEADPAWRLEHRELLHKLDEALARLGESERETFLLYWFGKLSYAEISGLTGLSVSAAKVRVHRALTHLSADMKGLGLEAGTV